MEPEARTTLAETPPPDMTAAARQRKAEAMLLVVTLTWGATFAITKTLLGTMGPMTMLVWRFGIAAIVFCLFYHHRLLGPLNSRDMIRGAILGIPLYAGFALQTLGLSFTSSSRSGFITSLYVVITPILQITVTRRIPSRWVFIGIGIVLAGLWGLTAPGGRLDGLLAPWREGGFGYGDALTLGCAGVFALYIILLDRYAQNADIVILTAAQLVVMAVLSTVQSLATEQWAYPSTAASWAQILYLAIFATVLSTYWQTLYQRDTTPTRAAVIYTMESVFAAIIGMLILNEQLGPVGVAGGLLIVAGLLVVQLKGNAGN